MAGADGAGGRVQGGPGDAGPGDGNPPLTRETAVPAFLDRLERTEARLLVWGLVDGSFADAEVLRSAEAFLDEHRLWGEFPEADDLVRALEAVGGLFPFFAGTERRYRTRMAEAVRLFARLRQLFPKHLAGGRWRLAPTLVSDYRLLLRARAVPRRRLEPSDTLMSLADELADPVRRSAAEALLNPGSRPVRLADFQLRATRTVLAGVRTGRPRGTVVCAGTGSGKTLAFYLPALVHLAPLVGPVRWTKCLAIYPRNELLKDQLAETYAQARRLDGVLKHSGGRGLLLGALFGSTPKDERAFDSKYKPTGWDRAEAGYVCPYLRCPACGGDVLWQDADRKQMIERLRCRRTDCEGEVGPGEVVLTRRRMLTDPPDVLFTTTEMLNQRLGDSRYGRLFGVGVPADQKPPLVLLDEAHTYAGTTGAQVALLLRRWQHVARCRPHFVGLSATLRDARRFFATLTGLPELAVEEVSPAGSELARQGTEYLLALRGDPVSGASLLSTTIQGAMLLRRILDPSPERPSGGLYGTRAFLFTDDLDVTNRLFFNLRDAEGQDSFGDPDPAAPGGSLANLRSPAGPDAAARFALGQDWELCRRLGWRLQPDERVEIDRTSSQDTGVSGSADLVVATAALEVGFNDPRVGAVLQHKAPRDPAQFLQRKGRAGRDVRMRPWTIVVLSDYGRDRLAYQAYDQLFDPELPARGLPVGNRHVLKIQAALAALDWIAGRLTNVGHGSVWQDAAVPADERTGERAVVEQRQGAIAELAEQVLTSEDRQAELAAYIGAALRVEPDEVEALLWDPPRAVLTTVLPTLVRRLRTQWRVVNFGGPDGREPYKYNAPLPEFLPRALFQELNVPEVTVVTPAQQRGDDDREDVLRVTQAMREFAPGRVSRRFGIKHRQARHWVAPPTLEAGESELPLPAYLARWEELGAFQWETPDGVRPLRCVRPWRIEPGKPDRRVADSSNAFLEWRTQIGPTGAGFAADVPSPSRWAGVLAGVVFHTHSVLSPVEVRRFAVASRATITFDDGGQLETRIRFVAGPGQGEGEPVGVGFAFDADGLCVQLRRDPAPHLVWASLSEGARRSLRAERFRDLVVGAAELDGVANRFARQWLAQVYLSGAAYLGAGGGGLKGAAERLGSERGLAELGAVLDVIFQSVPLAASGDEDRDDATDADEVPAGPVEERRRQRLHQKLLDLLQNPALRTVLTRAAESLWEEPGPGWDGWLRRKTLATVGAAVLDAAQLVCPDLDTRELVVDVAAGPRPPGSPPPPEGIDEVWLTESAAGGGGVLERLLSRYGEDPRRFWGFVEQSLEPGPAEETDAGLRRVLGLALTAGPVADAIGAVRASYDRSHAELAAAFDGLLAALRSAGVAVGHTLSAALAARLLRPGSTPDLDRLVHDLLADWHRAEGELGVDIDVRVYAYLRCGDDRLDAALRQTARPEGGTTVRRHWRFTALYGLLWPRGREVRNQHLRAFNPFDDLPDAERELALAALAPPAPPIDATADGWLDRARAALVADGSVALAGGGPALRAAVLRMAAEPVDAPTVQLDPRVSSVRPAGTGLVLVLDLPEGLQ